MNYVPRLRLARPRRAATPQQLRVLASRLIELNDRKGAVALMLLVATGKRPGAAEVEELMYLWGPRAEPDAVAWTSVQALAATDAELPKWLEHLAYLGDPHAVISVIQRRPQALAQSAGAVRAYNAALVLANTNATVDLRSAVASASGPDQLAALAQLALDTKQPAVAWQAVRAGLVAAPRNQEILSVAALAASALHRSDDAASLSMQLLATGLQSTETYVDAGDALIAAKRGADGRKALETALSHLPTDPATLATARLRARALTLLGRTDEAATLLTSWLARVPDHAGLRADLMQLDLARKSGG